MATFLLGAWIECGLLLAYLTLQNMRSPARVTTDPMPPAAQRLQKLGDDDARLLLRYQAVEQNRRTLYLWENMQFVLGFTLLLCLYLGTQRRIMPLVFCGMMLALAAIQHFGILPELTYRGRDADFPPGNVDFSIQARVWALEQIYAGLEGVKLLMGAVLASYLFVFRASGRTRSRVRKEVDVVDHADHGHVDR